MLKTRPEHYLGLKMIQHNHENTQIEKDDESPRG